MQAKKTASNLHQNNAMLLPLNFASYYPLLSLSVRCLSLSLSLCLSLSLPPNSTTEVISPKCRLYTCFYKAKKVHLIVQFPLLLRCSQLLAFFLGPLFDGAPFFLSSARTSNFKHTKEKKFRSFKCNERKLPKQNPAIQNDK